MEPMSASTRRTLEIVKRASTAVALLLSILCIYLIRTQSGRTTSTYKSFLIGIVITSQLHDISLHMLFDPVPLLPTLCLYSEGLLFRYFGIDTMAALGVWMICLDTNSFPYGLCFAYRNQVILSSDHRFKFSLWTFGAFFISLFIVYVLSIPVLQYTVEPLNDVSRADIIEKFSSNWPSDIADRISCFKTSRVHWHIAYSNVSVSIIFTFNAVFCSHTLYTLSKMVTMSDQTRRYHRDATKALIIQVSIPGATLFFPVYCIILQMAVQFENKEFMPIMLTIMGFHSIVHSITLILCTKSFRTALTRKKMGSVESTSRNA